MLIYEEFGYIAFNRLKLNEKVSFYPNLSNTGEYRLNFDLNASLPLFKWLEWNSASATAISPIPPSAARPTTCSQPPESDSLSTRRNAEVARSQWILG